MIIIDDNGAARDIVLRRVTDCGEWRRYAARLHVGNFTRTRIGLVWGPLSGRRWALEDSTGDRDTRGTRAEAVAELLRRFPTD